MLINALCIQAVENTFFIQDKIKNVNLFMHSCLEVQERHWQSLHFWVYELHAIQFVLVKILQYFFKSGMYGQGFTITVWLYSNSMLVHIIHHGEQASSVNVNSSV